MGYWEIFSEKDDYEEQERKLKEEQIKAIKKIKIKGIEKVIEFSSSVKDPFVVGVCLSESGISLEEEIIILDLLDKTDKKVINGYQV